MFTIYSSFGSAFVFLVVCLFWMKRITFEISNELHHRLKLLCYTEGISQGEVLRECVKNYTDSHEAHLIEIIDKRKKN